MKLKDKEELKKLLKNASLQDNINIEDLETYAIFKNGSWSKVSQDDLVKLEESIISFKPDAYKIAEDLKTTYNINIYAEHLDSTTQVIYDTVEALEKLLNME